MRKKRAALGTADDVFGSRVCLSLPQYLSNLHTSNNYVTEYHRSNKQTCFDLTIFNFAQSGLDLERGISEGRRKLATLQVFSIFRKNGI